MPSAKTRSSAPSADVTAPSPGAGLACDQVIDTVDAPPAGRVVVAGAVAVPNPAALQVNPSGETAPPLRLFAKSGLVVRAASVVELRVPPAAADRLRIGWGNAARPGMDVRVEGCADRTGWLVFAGGYWVDEPGCLPLTVRAGGRDEDVRIGVGVACPGTS
jgi:hypothetical protein